MKLEDIEDHTSEFLDARKTELWDMIKEKFDGDTSVVAEICEIEYELTKREFVGPDPLKELKDVSFSIEDEDINNKK